MASVIISGYVTAITDKSILLDDERTGIEAWYSRKYSTIMGGHLQRGEWLRLSVPQWLYEKTTGKQSAPPPATQSRAGATVPPDMLKRLIQLCHPDKHDGSKASTLATEWLLQQRARVGQ